MHEAGARQHRELGVEVQQRILQRARAVAGARDARPGRRACRSRAARRRHARPRAESARAATSTAASSSVASASSSPPFRSVRALASRPPTRELAGVDPGPQTAAREFGQQRGRRLIEAAAGELGGHRQALTMRLTAPAASGPGNFRLYCIVKQPRRTAALLPATYSSGHSTCFESAKVSCCSVSLRSRSPAAAASNTIEDEGPELLYETRRSTPWMPRTTPGAIQYFHALEARYPFSPETRQAQLDLIYLYYRSQQPELGDRRGRGVRAREPDPRAHRLLPVHARPRLFRSGAERHREDVARRPHRCARRRTHCGRSRRFRS